MDLPCESREYVHFRSWKVTATLSDYSTHLVSTCLQTKWLDEVGSLLGGQGEVGQVHGGTLHGPGPDQASPDVKQHHHKCCPSHNEGSIGDISVRLGDKES